MMRLITIGVSHFCEKARWALERAGVAYKEERHVPVAHRVASKRAGGRGTVPVLITPEGRVIPDSTDILLHIDAGLPEARRLYPTEAAELREVKELEDLFDEKLGPHTRRFAYFYLLDRTELAQELLGEGVGAWEFSVFKVLMPVAKAIMRKAMNINAASAERSRQKIQEVFAEVDRRLADGRQYLAAGRFTAADLAFAALAAPILGPPQYGARLPRDEQIPAPLLEAMNAWRKTPAGQYGLRLYATERKA